MPKGNAGEPMSSEHRKTLTRAFLVLALVCLIPAAVQAQGRGRGNGNGGGGGKHGGGGDNVGVTAEVTLAGVTLSAEMSTQIRSFYASHPASNVESLPPGIRRNLARGKPLPPGIAKRSAPPELASHVHLRDGYELVEVGVDVFLVEVATNVVHDVLMDVIR